MAQGLEDLLVSFILPEVLESDKIAAVTNVTTALYSIFNGLFGVKSVEFVGFRKQAVVLEARGRHNWIASNFFKKVSIYV